MRLIIAVLLALGSNLALAQGEPLLECYLRLDRIGPHTGLKIHKGRDLRSATPLTAYPFTFSLALQELERLQAAGICPGAESPNQEFCYIHRNVKNDVQITLGSPMDSDSAMKEHNYTFLGSEFGGSTAQAALKLKALGQCRRIQEFPDLLKRDHRLPLGIKGESQKPALN